MSVQLSMFDSIPNKDTRPLPLIVADNSKWRFALTYIDRDGNPDNYLYLVVDWIAGLTRAANPSRIWTEQFDSVEKLILLEKERVKNPNGKSYMMHFTNAKGLYTVAQHLRVTEKRPQLKAILDFLTDAGVLADRARRDPEGVAKELTARAKGIKARNEMTSTAQETHVRGMPAYAALTDTEYQYLFGGVKRELVKRMALNETQADHFRDYLGEFSIKALEMCESAIAIKMRQVGRKLNDSEQLEFVRVCAIAVEPSFRTLCEYLGIDNLRNEALLGGGQ